MKVLVTRVQILSLLMVLLVCGYAATLSIQVAAYRSHSKVKHFNIASIRSATQTNANSNGNHFNIALVPSATQSGPVNISINDTVVATNIEVTKKNSLVVPITIPDNVLNGPIRICATLVAPSEAQICTDVQNMKQVENNRITLDLAKALAG